MKTGSKKKVKTVAKTSDQAPAAAAKQFLVRGIDPIPEDWELASSFLASNGLRRSATILDRLTSEAVKAGNRNLWRAKAKAKAAAS
jgi:hypothetical protein